MSKTELTTNIGADKFDLCPADVTSEVDKQRWEEFRRKYHKAQNLEEVFDFPLQLDFGLHSRCNLKCSFCVQKYSPPKSADLGFPLFRKAIDEGSRYGLCSIKVNLNNEPLLDKWLPHYIKYAKGRGVLNVYMASNGTLLTEEMSRELIAAGLSKIMISLDATTRDTYEKMRNKNRFDEVVTNINNFLRIRKEEGVSWPLLRVNFLQTELNKHEKEDFLAYWKDRADMVGFQDLLTIPDVKQNWVSEYPEEFHCAFPFKQIVINAEGTMLPCCTFNGDKLPLGNLANMTIKEAWDSSWMQQLRELHRQGLYRINTTCVHCLGKD